MTELKIDTAQRVIQADVLLKGEDQPLHIEVKNYRVTQDEESMLLEIGEVSVSREWIHSVATEFLNGRRFRLPTTVAVALRLIL